MSLILSKATKYLKRTQCLNLPNFNKICTAKILLKWQKTRRNSILSNHKYYFTFENQSFVMFS